jgi:RHS repeat-associated protein
VFLLASVVNCQILNVGDDTSTPIPAAGHDYIKMLSETVNPANGSVSVRIKTPIPTGRGISLPFSFAYDSNGAQHLSSDGVGLSEWWDNSAYLSQGGWSYSLPMLSNVRMEAPLPPHGVCFYWTDYVFQDPTGGRHPLGVSYVYGTGNNPCLGASPLPGQVLNGGDDYYRASLGSSVTALAAITDADGTVYSFPTVTQNHPSKNVNSASSLPSIIEDRNGNEIVVTDNGSGSFTVTDALGRTLLSNSGFGGSNTVAVSGLSSPYAITWGTATANFSINSWLMLNVEGDCYSSLAPDTNNTFNVIKSIELPNGQSYQFSYDATYGMLNKVTYPTGGYVQYAWGLNPRSEGSSFEDTKGEPNDCQYQRDSPAVTERTVSFDGVHTALTQTFNYSTTWSSTDLWSAKTTTVTTTDNIAGAVSIAAYTYVPIDAPEQPNDFRQFATQIPLEQTIAYESSAGTALRTVTKAWYDQYELKSVQTALNDGANIPTDETTYAYGPGAQVTQKDEYDFGSGAHGSLLRQTNINYQTLTGTEIFDKPCQVIVYNGSSTRYAETDYFYDNGSTGTVCGTSGTPSVTGVSNLTGHDETNYSASSTHPRGNLTQKTQWLGTGSSPVTKYSYDETGQTLSETDPNINTTSYSFSDSFVSTNSTGFTSTAGAPPSGKVTNAYLTKITYPVVNEVAHIEKFSYGYNDGELTKATDENSKTTTYKYNDSLDRPTETDYPDNGQTTLAYNDSEFSPSVTTTKLITTSLSESTTAVADGMGHVVQIELVSDPDGATYTATTYDGLGRKYTETNPYRSVSDPTYGITTYVYDALSRTCVLVPPGGTAASTCPTTAPAGDKSMFYSGRATELSDEGNGTRSVQRVSQVDGLGRLASVCEVTSTAPPHGPGPGACGQDITATGFLTSYSYDPLGNLLAVGQGSLSSRTFAYDSLSHLLCAANPETGGSVTCPNPDNGAYTAGTTRYAYDADGNMISRVRPAPNQPSLSTTDTTSYQYDALNRLTYKSYSDGVTLPVEFGYDQASLTMGSQQFNIINSIGRLSWSCTLLPTNYCASTMVGNSYDPMGRIAELWQENAVNNNNIWISYQYDLLGDETNRDLSGNTYAATYSSAGRLTSFTATDYTDGTNPANLLTGAHYDPFGHLTSATLANGLTESWGYDNRGRPQAMALGTACSAGVCTGSTVYSTSITNGSATGYAPNGNILFAKDSVNGTWAYTYDDFNHLLTSNCSATCPDGTSAQGFSYGYDRYGNRWSQTLTAGSGPQPSFTFNGPSNVPNNRIDGYSYDAAGNLLNDGFHSYTYDGENRISSVDNGGTTYVYDADGQRVAKTTSGAATDYIYDREGRIMLYALNPAPASSPFIEMNVAGLHLGTYDLNSSGTDTIFYYDHADWLGTERARTNLTGAACETIQSLPFGDGQAIAGSCSDISPLHFTGKERDSESGLDYFNARHYGSSMGRFMQADPLPWLGWQHPSEESTEEEKEEAHKKFEDWIGNPQNLNMYAYVLNNPLRYTDPTGMSGCQAGDKTFSTCTITITYDPKTSQGTLVVTGQNQGDKSPTTLLTTSVVVGGDGHVTPTGTFTATTWEKDHVSTKYGQWADTPYSKTTFGMNAFGPFQLHIKELDSRGIYIHGTMGPSWNPFTGLNSLVSPTSHGCIRMCNRDDVALHNLMPNPAGNKIIIQTAPNQ